MGNTSLRLPAAMIEQIEKIIEGRLDNPDRSSVIRELLAEALEMRRRRRR